MASLTIEELTITIDLQSCEEGAPCAPGVICRIHRLRAWFIKMEWLKKGKI